MLTTQLQVWLRNSSRPTRTRLLLAARGQQSQLGAQGLVTKELGANLTSEDFSEERRNGVSKLALDREARACDGDVIGEGL